MPLAAAHPSVSKFLNEVHVCARDADVIELLHTQVAKCKWTIICIYIYRYEDTLMYKFTRINIDKWTGDDNMKVETKIRES